jgi:hypothetical protein
MADKKTDRPSELLLDKRLVERQIAKGALSKAELEKQLKELPDLADKCDNIATIVYPNQGN